MDNWLEQHINTELARGEKQEAINKIRLQQFPLMVQLRMMEAQIHMIIAQPIMPANFESCHAIEGEHGREIIIKT